MVLREAKPGCFQTRVFPTFFGTGPDCVADPFGTVQRKRANRENPRTIPEQIGKIPGKDKKGQKRTKKDKKGRTSPDRETPPFETPPFSGP